MKALIGMSGGVDSAVAAYLTLAAGGSGIGATMRLLQSNDADAEDARRIAQGLGMEHRVLDLGEVFRRLVIADFVSSYEAGLTPNPCIVCNKALKFGVLLDAAEKMGCTHVVTGHYARIRQADNGRWLLCKGAETARDQSYFLYSLSQHQLSHAHFPLGELTKAEVRQIAETKGFVNARKRDSQDICFVPDGDYVSFLERYTGKRYSPGNILDQSGKVVGIHKGAVACTLGQRKGLGLAMGEPVYVCGKDMAANTVTVGPNEALLHTTVVAENPNWFPFDTLDAPLEVMAKARSRMAEQPATVYPMEDGRVRVVFHEAQRAMTPGQAVVFYDGDTVLGGGTITHVL